MPSVTADHAVFTDCCLARARSLPYGLCWRPGFGRRGDTNPMNRRLSNRLSRLYDGPLASSLTALAIIALSIVVSVTL